MNTKSSGSAQAPSTYCAFHVGQHVVCIKSVDPTAIARITKKGGSGNMPVEGVVYTVRDVYVSPNPRLAHKTFIRLSEISNRRLAGHEPGFPTQLFRPLQKLRVENFMSAPADLEGVSA